MTDAELDRISNDMAHKIAGMLGDVFDRETKVAAKVLPAVRVVALLSDVSCAVVKGTLAHDVANSVDGSEELVFDTLLDVIIKYLTASREAVIAIGTTRREAVSA